MNNQTRKLELTDKEITMLFYMAGYSCNECLRAYPKEYASLMKKLNELVCPS